MSVYSLLSQLVPRITSKETSMRVQDMFLPAVVFSRFQKRHDVFGVVCLVGTDVSVGHTALVFMIDKTAVSLIRWYLPASIGPVSLS